MTPLMESGLSCTLSIHRWWVLVFLAEKSIVARNHRVAAAVGDKEEKKPAEKKMNIEGLNLT